MIRPLYAMAWVRWRTLITRYDSPRCFVDEQLAGPYSFWHHIHRFEHRNGGTQLTDEVHYALPMLLLGPLSDLVHAAYVRPALLRIFDYRQQVFAQLFGGNAQAGARTALSATEEGAL